MHRQARAASFDSATQLSGAVANFLSGRDTQLLGASRVALAPLLLGLNLLPPGARERFYAAGSGREARSAQAVAKLDGQRLARQALAPYPRRPYQIAAIGSTPGAAAHLCAALGAPLLPQTLLVPLRQRGVHPDDARTDLALSRQTVRSLLDGNPDLVVHQMRDPNADRLTLRYFTYLRIKRLNLGEAYERFLEENLSPGATLVVVDCRARWPTTTVGPRHVFQFGGMGGLETQGYRSQDARVANFLGRYGSTSLGWDPPAVDGCSPEAEWGFHPALAEDLASFARSRGLHIRRLVFEHPDDLSPLVADLYRWWYERRGLRTSRLVVESFILTDPWCTLRTASVPYWMTFNMQPSADRLLAYLERADPYDFIDLIPISNGVDAVGLVPIEGWERIAARARRRGRVVGTDPRRYPRDLSVFARYHDSLAEAPRHSVDLAPMSMAELDEFLEAHPSPLVSVIDE